MQTPFETISDSIKQLSLDNLNEHMNNYNIDVDFQINLQDIINRHFCTSMKKTQQIFRESNKKNNFTLTSFNEYINILVTSFNEYINMNHVCNEDYSLYHSFHKLLLHINNHLTHINTNYIIDTAMNNIHRFILHDNIIFA